MELERAQKIAERVVKCLSPHCWRIEIVGSIRRKKPFVNDIDLVLIPNALWDFPRAIAKLGDLKVSGGKVLRVMVGVMDSSIQVDVYIASEATWATLLLIRTGSAENNIRLASAARKRGWQLKASGQGLLNENGERVAGDTEESIYAALGLPWQEPEERG